MQKILLVFSSCLWMNTVGESRNHPCSLACAEQAKKAGGADKEENAEAKCNMMMPYYNCLKTNEKCKDFSDAQNILADGKAISFMKDCEEKGHGASSTYSSVVIIVASVLAVKLF